MHLVGLEAVKPAELASFLACFGGIVLLGFAAARWRRPANPDLLHEWGLGGRSFGTWVTWFLVGGDFYTAYTIIAVPALVYASGAYGFFAMPYAMLVYPLVFAIVPRLWRVAAAAGHVTAGDVVRARFGSRPLEIAVAATGIAATMPYIALQLVGMQVAVAALGVHGEWPLVAAFGLLAAYTYVSGLRAPALIAFAKDGLVYLVVFAALAAVAVRLGPARLFAAGPPAGGLLLKPAQMLPYASLALGSAAAAFLYPHTLTSMFAARSEDTVRRNAVLLPAYTVLLGIIALLGYAARALQIKAVPATAVVPALFQAIFPPWFAGIGLAAIAVGALVPAAVMSIGAANLYARNIHPALFAGTGLGAQARVARNASLWVKAGALAAILFLPTQYAIDLQLLGGVAILQTFPALVGGLARRGLSAPGLLAGWVAGMVMGGALAVMDGLKPVHLFHAGAMGVGLYTGLAALAVNAAIAYGVSMVLPARAAS